MLKGKGDVTEMERGVKVNLLSRNENNGSGIPIFHNE